MIYLPTPGLDACVHLATEYYFTVEHPLPEPVLLLWQTAPSVILGQFQNTLAEVNLPYLTEHHIALVRRPSGGGAIYSDEGNWMYSILTEGTGAPDFRAGAEPLRRALVSMGVPVSWSGRNDLLVQGRKISGAAQYQKNGRTVHHGTLLFDTDLSRMEAATRVDAQKLQSKGIASVRARVLNLKEVLPDMDARQFGAALLAAMHPEGPVYEPTAADWARIHAIADQRFRGWANVQGKNPRCTWQTSRRFPAGTVTLRLSLHHGVITEAALAGDYFAGPAAEGIAEALVGCPLTRPAVSAALAPYDGAIYGISAGELTELALEALGAAG